MKSSFSAQDPAPDPSSTPPSSTPPHTPPSSPPPKKLSKPEAKILSLSALGGALEFYDFIIFAFFASYISKNFFPPDLDPFWQLFNTYGAFAAGYLARPLGGVVMAHFGDKFGRKNTFMFSILLMVIPTFALAFIPGFSVLGYWAIILLLAVRLLQGIAIGGELPGAWVFVVEHCAAGARGLVLSCLNSAMALGILLGSLIFLLMQLIFTPEELVSWAWRAPFFLGGIFGLIAVYLRRFLNETPVFIRMREERALQAFPLKALLRTPGAGLAITAAMLISWVLTGCVLIFLILMPGQLAPVLSLPPSSTAYLQIAGILILIAASILAGLASDRFGALRVCAIFALLFAASGAVFFALFYEKHSLTLAAYLAASFFAGLNVFAPILMCELFEAKFRFSGISFSYNIAYAIAGGLTPQLLFALNHAALNGSFRAGAGAYIFILALAAILACILTQKLRKKPCPSS